MGDTGQPPTGFVRVQNGAWAIFRPTQSYSGFNRRPMAPSLGQAPWTDEIPENWTAL
jgi:hypothetical protein